MSTNILIIDGHPNANSLGASLAQTYHQTALAQGAQVERLAIRDLQFNPNLAFGYQRRTEWEPDLQRAWDLISQANHLVWIHPVWWGGLPAILKGFIDRVFLPGLVFKYRENSVWWDKLLAGKTGRIICTLDQPYFYYQWINGRPGIHQLKRMTLEFCGVSPVKVSAFGPIRNAPEAKLKKILAEVEKAARSDVKTFYAKGAK